MEAKKSRKPGSIDIPTRVGHDLIRVSIDELNGNKFLNVRKYYFNGDEDEYKPTPKGIAIPIAQAHAVIEALTEFSKYVKQFEAEAVKPSAKKDKKGKVADDEDDEVEPAKVRSKKRGDAPKKIKGVDERAPARKKKA